MRQAIRFSLLVLVLAVPALAEEFVLKDGTKIVGRMTAIRADKIEVETPYGKMQIRRADIRTINFPENESVPMASQPKTAPQVDEALDGTHYVNRSGRFTLIVPIEWKINSELRAEVNDAIAGLSSRDSLRFLLVTQESFSGLLESYKGLAELQARQSLENYEKLAESPVTIDGRPAVLLSYRGTTPRANNLPIQFLVGIVGYEGEFVRITTWCIEPMFNESQRTFENIILSYRKLREQTSPAPGSKPPSR